MDVGFIGLGNIEAIGEPTWTRTNRLSGLRTLPAAFTGARRVYA